MVIRSIVCVCGVAVCMGGGASAQGPFASVPAGSVHAPGPITPLRSSGCTYSADDGGLETALGLGSGGGFGWFNRFDATAGCDIITAIEVVWGGPVQPPANGMAARVHLWEDPNDDGDPADAVLIADVPVVVTAAGTGAFVTHAIPPTRVSGAFFVGASLTHTPIQRPASLDETAPVVAPPVSYLAANPGGDFNAVNLGANVTPPATTAAFDLPGELLVRASSNPREYTYQGRLEDADTPVTGVVDVRIDLHEVETGGTLLSTHTALGVAVLDGLFSVRVPIEANVLDGSDRWLEISIANPAGSGFVTLSPRQKLTQAPIASVAERANEADFALVADAAIEAQALANPLPWTQLSGVPAGFADGVDNVGGDGNSLDAADGSPVDAVFVDASGRVGMGTTTPLTDLHVKGLSGTQSGVMVTPLVATSEGVSRLTLGEDDDATFNMQLEYDGATNRLVVYGQSTATRVGPWMTIARDNGRVGINMPVATAPSGQLHVVSAPISVTPLIVDRTSSDGPLVDLRRDGASVGAISVSGGVVTYGAFTGVHYARGADGLPRGTLVRMSGDNGRVGETGTEIIYGVEATAIANDPAVLGAYIASQPGEGGNVDGTTHDLIMSDGNGEILVVETGRNIAPGDALVSSDIAGCAMLDDVRRFAVGHVVARAAEPVDWSRVAPGADGVKRALVSVLFDRFTREGDPGAMRAEIDAVRAENADLRKRLEALERAIEASGAGGGR